MESKTYLVVFFVIVMFIVTTNEYIYIKQNPQKQYFQTITERFAETREMVVDTFRLYANTNTKSKIN